MDKDYNEKSISQVETAEVMYSELLKMCAVRWLQEGGGVRRVVDYGCSGGNTSMRLLRLLLDSLENETKTNPDHTQVCLEMILNDQLFNDWSVTLDFVFRHTLVAQSKAVVLASPCSFYQPVVGAGTAHLGIASHSIHWLSTPVLGSDRHQQRARSTEWQRAAARDWHTWLKLRHGELANHGKLLVLMHATVNGRSSWLSLYSRFHQVLDEMVADGVMEKRYGDSVIFPSYFRGEEDVTSCALLCEGHPERCFSVDRLQLFELPCSFRRQLDSGAVDREQWAQETVDNFRCTLDAIMCRCLRSAAVAEGMCVSEAELLVQRLRTTVWERLQQSLVADCGQVQLDTVAFMIQLGKV